MGAARPQPSSEVVKGSWLSSMGERGRGLGPAPIPSQGAWPSPNPTIGVEEEALAQPWSHHWGAGGGRRGPGSGPKSAAWKDGDSWAPPQDVGLGVWELGRRGGGHINCSHSSASTFPKPQGAPLADYYGSMDCIWPVDQRFSIPALDKDQRLVSSSHYISETTPFSHLPYWIWSMMINDTT